MEGKGIIIIVTLTLVVVSTWVRARRNYKVNKFRKEHQKRKKANISEEE